MKKTLLLLAFVFVTVSVHAQVTLDSAIREKISRVNSAETVAEFTALKDDFVLLTNNKKYGWLPAYYAAVSSYNEGYLSFKKGDKAGVTHSTLTALKYLSGISQSSNNEVQIIKGLIYTLQIKSDAEKYSSKNSTLVKEIISRVANAESGNPRLALLEAELMTATNSSTGSEVYADALKKFDKQPSKSNSDPTWGKNLITNIILGE